MIITPYNWINLNEEIVQFSHFDNDFAQRMWVSFKTLN